MSALRVNRHPPHAVARGLAALLAGTLFGIGLALAQMIDPLKVLGFLDLAGEISPAGVRALTSGASIRLPSEPSAKTQP